MGTTLTTNYSLIKPNIFEEFDSWGTHYNDTMDLIDAALTAIDALADANTASIVAIQAKTDFITITQAVNLDTVESNANTAFGWGDHGVEGYATVTGAENLTNKTITSAAFSGTHTGNFTTTGNITIDSAGSAYFSIDASASGEEAQVAFLTGGSARWAIEKQNNAESGSNVGSDFSIRAFSDAGSGLGTYLTIARSTGNVTIANALTVNNGLTVSNGMVIDTEVMPALALDPANGLAQTKTLTANSTFTDSLADGEFITLFIDDGAAYTITWPTITWVSGGGSAPTLQTTGNTVIQLFKLGSTLYGNALNGA